jgi:hypothetical protein
LYIKILFVPHIELVVSIRKAKLLMMRREIIAVYCKNRKEDVNMGCGQSNSVCRVKLGVHVTTRRYIVNSDSVCTKYNLVDVFTAIYDSCLA